MGKNLMLYALFFFLGSYCQGQVTSKNIFGVSAGLVPAYSNMFLDEPFNSWSERETGPLYHIFYARQVRESFRIGSYYEYEQAKFRDSESGSTFGFDRYNIGIDWLGHFNISVIQLQMGGYMGFGFLKAQTWDRPWGYDLGLIAGPAWEHEKIGLALHVNSGYAFYHSSGSPSGVMLYSPKILLKAYYRFKWPGRD